MLPTLKLVDGTEIPLPDGERKASKFIAATMLNSGYSPTNPEVRVDWQDFVQKFWLKDTVGVTHIRPLLSTSIQMILREPVEPLMQITGLFNRVAAKGLDTRVLGGAIGAVYADDVGEMGQYPEVNFQIAGGFQTATIGKSGIQASFTDEALRYTTWDIMAINLRLMRNALIRHKEQKAIAALRSMGTELFNNLSPSTSLFGVCTGRGIDMQPNGSVIMDDLFKGMAHMTEEGHPPDILLLNPQMFYLWIQDPVLRNMLLAHGGGAYFQKWNGNPGPTDPWSNGAIGMAGPQHGTAITPVGAASGGTPTGIVGREHGMTSSPTIPSYFPWSFQVMVSPFVPYDSTTGLSDAYLISSGNIGMLLVDEEPIQVEWRDEDKELTKVRIKERYSFHIGNEGQAIGVMRYIPNKRNYWDGTIHATTMEVLEEIAVDHDLSSVL